MATAATTATPKFRLMPMRASFREEPLPDRLPARLREQQVTLDGLIKGTVAMWGQASHNGMFRHGAAAGLSGSLSLKLSLGQIHRLVGWNPPSLGDWIRGYDLADDQHNFACRCFALATLKGIGAEDVLLGKLERVVSGITRMSDKTFIFTPATSGPVKALLLSLEATGSRKAVPHAKALLRHSNDDEIAALSLSYLASVDMALALREVEEFRTPPKECGPLDTMHLFLQLKDAAFCSPEDVKFEILENLDEPHLRLAAFRATYELGLFEQMFCFFPPKQKIELLNYGAGIYTEGTQYLSNLLLTERNIRLTGAIVHYLSGEDV